MPARSKASSMKYSNLSPPPFFWRGGEKTAPSWQNHILGTGHLWRKKPGAMCWRGQWWHAAESPMLCPEPKRLNELAPLKNKLCPNRLIRTKLKIKGSALQCSLLWLYMVSKLSFTSDEYQDWLHSATEMSVMLIRVASTTLWYWTTAACFSLHKEQDQSGHG